MNTFLQALLAALSPNFATVGYRLEGGFRFYKTEPGRAKRSVSFDLLKPRDGYLKVAVYAHLLFPEIEAVYAKHHPHLEASQAGDHQTLSINCDNLFSDRSIAGSFRNDSPPPQVASRLWGGLEADVLPFLETYSQLEVLEENLSLAPPRARVTSDALARYCILLSAAALRCDKSLFERYKAEFLEHCARPHMRQWHPIAAAVSDGIETAHFPAAT